MSEWKEYKLGDLGLIVTGKTPSSNNPKDFGNFLPFVTPSDYKNYKKTASCSERYLSKNGADKLKSKLLPPKSVLVTCIGSDMGKVAINTIPVITNQQINSIICDITKVNSDFLYYKLVEQYDILRSYGLAGTAVPIVNKTDFENIEISLPPLPEQREIAGVLSSLDDKIDLLHRQNKTLESMAEALWRRMFVEDADPNWGNGKLGDLFTLHRGYDLPSQSRNEGEYPIVSASGINGFHNNFKSKAPGVVTGRSGLLGKVFFIIKDFWPLNTSLYISDFKLGTPLFSYFFLRTIDLDSLNGGSAVPTLNRNDVHSLELNLPPREKITFFENITFPLYQKIGENELQINSLENIRDILLPKFMSCEVKVKQ